MCCCVENNAHKSNGTEKTDYLTFSKDILNFQGTPRNKTDRSMLMFSDQGAWFAYSLPNTVTAYGGFSGPFLLTQENGIWAAPTLSQYFLSNSGNEQNLIDWKNDLEEQKSFASHLEQTYQSENLKIGQELVFLSGHTALQRTIITNKSEEDISIDSGFQGKLFSLDMRASKEDGGIKIGSSKSEAVGHIQFIKGSNSVILTDSLTYKVANQSFVLRRNESKQFVISQTFIFPEYSWDEERISILQVDFDSLLNTRKAEKENELNAVISNQKVKFKDVKYSEVLAKAHLTLQNNWRIPAGALKHQGLFPSYHYEWFHGFWAWDSWKHAVGLSYFNPQLAKDQVRALFDFQREDGFILDCIYRDTTIEPHNYRDTKPPLSAWAVSKIYEHDLDLEFVTEMYPKLKKYHQWWYDQRDHDKDGLCEFGSTDGTLIAAKWESGMDNAIRFDTSKILKNAEGAFSLDQESVDLNAYLYAEKNYLALLAAALNKTEEASTFKKDAALLKKRIQEQFYDPEDEWFYDTNLEGTIFIKGAGSEGWTPLWANAATKVQAVAVKDKMMDPDKFYTQVPFQTLSKDHPKFDPLNGYWRGPNWLDQAYFGIKGLRNYGFEHEADKATSQILLGANGLLQKGTAIRENYHPITGEGREAQNFSWSAAHIIMLLMEDDK